MLTSFQSLLSPIAARLSRRIAFWVFASIVAIEIVIFIPSYLKHERELLLQLEQNGLAALSSVGKFAIAEGPKIDLPSLAKKFIFDSHLSGGSIYQPNGQMIGVFGEHPEISFSDMNGTHIVRARSRDGSIGGPAHHALGGGSDFHGDRA